MAKQGGKHLVRCSCVLPQLSKQKNPPDHEFVVFSVYDDETGEFDASFVQCDNCGVIHKVVEFCVSVILRGRDELKSVVTVDDLKKSVSAPMAEVLEQNRADLPTWQQLAWIIEEEQWGTPVILSSEYLEGVRQGKIMTVIGKTLYKISNFMNETAAR